MAKQTINEVVDKVAFEQLEKLSSLLVANNKAMDELVKMSLKMKNTPLAKSYDEATKATKAYQAQQTALNKALIEQQKLEQETLRTAKLITAAKEKEAKEKQRAAKAAEEEASAYKRLSRELEIARKAAKDLGAQYGTNSKVFKEASANVQTLDKRIKDIDGQLGQSQRHVGKYEKIWAGVKGAVIGAAAGFASFTAVTKAAQFVIASTNTLADEFSFTMGSVKESLGVVGRAFANLDFKDFGDKLRDAAKAGREYAKAMDEVQDRARGLTVQEEIIKGLMLDQEKIFRDRRRSEEERLKAGQEMKRLQAELTEEAVKNTTRELDANLKLAASQSRLSQEEIKRYVVANNGSFAQIQLGEQLIGKYNALNTSAVKTGNAIADFFINLRAGTGASKEQAEVFKSQLTPAQLEAFEAAKKYGNITDEVRDKIAANMVTSLRQANAEKEKAVSMLRVEASIQKGLDRTAESTRGVTKETIATVEARRLEAEALSPVIDLLIKMGVASEDVIDFQKRMTEAAGTSVKDQFELRKGGKEKLDQLNKDYNQKELSEEKALWDVKKQIAAEGVQNIAAFENAYFDSKMMNLNAEREALEKQKEQGLITEQNYQQQREALDKKARKIARDKAISDRILASAQVVFNFAIAQAEAASISPLTLGQPWAGILMAMQGLSLAAIWAAPLPKLAKGIRNSPAMFAEVGEAGPELVETNGQAQWVTKSTKMFLPEGSNVIPLKDLAAMSGAFSIMPTTDNDGRTGYDLTKLTEQLARDNEALRRTIKDKDTIAEVKMRGVYEGLNWDAYVNQNFRR
jgi:hypothetical protein